MYKLVYFVPESHLDVTKTAVFSAGAGVYSHYDQCCWQVKGVGQFRPLSGADPHIGNVNQLERCEEYRVEILCRDELIDEVIRVLLESHPYEEVAYEAVRLDKCS